MKVDLEALERWMREGQAIDRDTLDALLEEVRAGREARVDDLRADGWTVAVHNDYRLNGEPHTFWLLTKDGRAIKGEGHTDADALNAIRAALASPSVPTVAAQAPRCTICGAGRIPTDEGELGACRFLGCPDPTADYRREHPPTPPAPPVLGAAQEPDTCPEEGCVLEADHAEPCDTTVPGEAAAPGVADPPAAPAPGDADMTRVLEKVTDLIAEFGDNPASALSIVNGYCETALHALRIARASDAIRAGGME